MLPLLMVSDIGSSDRNSKINDSGTGSRIPPSPLAQPPQQHNTKTLHSSPTSGSESEPMDVIKSHIHTKSADFLANAEHHRGLAKQLQERLQSARQGGSTGAVQKQR